MSVAEHTTGAAHEAGLFPSTFVFQDNFLSTGDWPGSANMPSADWMIKLAIVDPLLVVFYSRAKRRFVIARRSEGVKPSIDVKCGAEAAFLRKHGLWAVRYIPLGTQWGERILFDLRAGDIQRFGGVNAVLDRIDDKDRAQRLAIDAQVDAEIGRRAEEAFAAYYGDGVVA